MIDFSNYDIRDKSNNGAPFHPTPPGFNKPIAEVTFWVRGAYSDEVRKIKIERARQAMIEKKGQRDPAKMSDEELLTMLEGSPETVAALIANWENVGLNGEVLECNEENKLLLMRDWPWLRQQIDEFAANIENFLPDAPEDGRNV